MIEYSTTVEPLITEPAEVTAGSSMQLNLLASCNLDTTYFELVLIDEEENKFSVARWDPFGNSTQNIERTGDKNISVYVKFNILAKGKVLYQIHTRTKNAGMEDGYADTYTEIGDSNITII